MFIQLLTKLFTYFALVLNVSGESYIEEGRVKRSDIDLQTCIDNFNVHRDKIIRTQDSQNMGAKYLNEIDLGSREECLRLCCETDNCDVFVFEEKNSGSCYLFHCGPPEDFKCKFTHHVNYSSAVLSINRHLPDLESQIKLTKHEQDLTKLRNPETSSGTLKAVVPEVRTTHSTVPTTISSKEVDPVRKMKASEPDRKCSLYQFECRSTRECIAIYNACDGIPQCADESDEAPELGCPDRITTPVPIPVHPDSAPVPVRYETNIQHPTNSNPQRLYLQPQSPRDPPQLAPVIPRFDADFLRSVNDPRNMNPRIQYDPQQYIPQLPVQGQANWIPHESNKLPPQISQFPDKNSRIFNHKETGYQVPDGSELSQMQYAENANGRDYPKMGNYYGDNNYRQPIQQENWPADEGGYENPRNIQDVVRNQDQLRKSPNFQPTSKQTPNIRTENVNPSPVQEQLAHDLKHSKDNMDHGNVGHENIKIEKHDHHEQYPDVVAYKISDANNLQDGVTQTQRGAVLSVTLGLVITFVMAVMIGCRIKMVRRRIRRGGKSYAHDADYLVNGLYL